MSASDGFDATVSSSSGSGMGRHAEIIAARMAVALHTSRGNAESTCTKANDKLSTQLVPVEEQRVGVPAYMAPEVYRRVPYGTPVDVYAFGAVLQRMLANAVPPNAFEKLRASLMQRPATASRWPPDLLELTRDCCAAEALHRPRARQLVELLASHAVSIDGAEG